MIKTTNNWLIGMVLTTLTCAAWGNTAAVTQVHKHHHRHHPPSASHPLPYRVNPLPAKIAASLEAQAKARAGASKYAQPPGNPPPYRRNPLEAQIAAAMTPEQMKALADSHIVSAAASAANPVTTPASASPLVLHEDQLLSRQLDIWAKRQNLRLLWNSKKDYVIYSTIVLKGKQRDDVLDQLGRLFQSENYGLVIKLYEANHVLLIDDQ